MLRRGRESSIDTDKDRGMRECIDGDQVDQVRGET